MKREHIWAHHEQDALMNWKLMEGGYPDRMSVKQGEEITLHISNSRACYDVFIFREGARRTLVRTLSDLRGQLHAVPALGYQDGFAWPSAASFIIPDDWPSGVYVATFPTGQGLRELLFVVRPKSPSAPLLLTIAANTYPAYNNVGGKCFYNYISTDRQFSPLISFERPLPIDWLGNFYIWDQFFTSWLDAESYAVDYCINSDHVSELDLLSQYRANLRIGHDEYNTMAECRQLLDFVNQGGNLLLFAGNCLNNVVELRNDRRQMYCHRPQPIHWPDSDDAHKTDFSLIDDLRQRVIGVFYTSYVHAKTDKPGVFLAPTTEAFGFYRVTQPEHWIYAGTSLREGDEFGREDSIVGGEADAADLVFERGRPRYTGSDGVSPAFQILALADCMIGDASRLTKEGRGSGQARCYGTVAINETEHKGTIFNAATIEWGHGLHRQGGPVAQITRNVLDRLAR
jgi:hypothetical protein